MAWTLLYEHQLLDEATVIASLPDGNDLIRQANKFNV
jgi:hypothetical protein